MANPNVTPVRSHGSKHDADYVFYELTRSICPACRRVIDAHIVIRNNKVYMRKRCPDHGPFEALVYDGANCLHQIVQIQQARHHPDRVLLRDQEWRSTCSIVSQLGFACRPKLTPMTAGV
jgi:uncharacterized radical SAM superfamily Fe-S cluster-containing enzyme